MKFWSPKKAAIHRAAEDAVKFYGIDRVRASTSARPVSPETILLERKLSDMKSSMPKEYEAIQKEMSRYTSSGGEQG